MRLPSASASGCIRARSSARWPAASGPKAAAASDDGAGDDCGDIERYEQLRARALAGDGAGRQLGLALLQRRGVAAWTHAWPRQPPPARPVAPVAVLAPAAEPELVGALASLALARLAA